MNNACLTKIISIYQTYKLVRFAVASFSFSASPLVLSLIVSMMIFCWHCSSSSSHHHQHCYRRHQWWRRRIATALVAYALSIDWLQLSTYFDMQSHPTIRSKSKQFLKTQRLIIIKNQTKRPSFARSNDAASSHHDLLLFVIDRLNWLIGKEKKISNVIYDCIIKNIKN